MSALVPLSLCSIQCIFKGDHLQRLTKHMICVCVSSLVSLICSLQIGLRQKLQTFPGKMVNTLHSDEEKGIQDKESKEESILAMLGIIGTILNLLVIIFVYIYTTL